MDQISIWVFTFFACLTFVLALKSDSPGGFAFYTMMFSICTATAVVGIVP